MKDIPNIFEIVSYILSILGSNTFVERIFLLMSNEWSESRNTYSQNLIKRELQITLNFSHECEDVVNSFKMITRLLADDRRERR